MERNPGARTRDQDLAVLAAGGETGWWDDAGHPAPWPEDFLDPDAGWSTGRTALRPTPIPSTRRSERLAVGDRAAHWQVSQRRNGRIDGDETHLTPSGEGQ
jgi:hypothetical protein